MHPTLKAELLALLEGKILAGKKATGRTGLDLWQILVLGVVRRGLDADWDRMEHVANYDTLVRQMLGLPAAPLAALAKGLALSQVGSCCGLQIRAPKASARHRESRMALKRLRPVSTFTGSFAFSLASSTRSDGNSLRNGDG